MLALIEAGDAGLALLRDAKAFAAQECRQGQADPDLTEIIWHPPVRGPAKSAASRSTIRRATSARSARPTIRCSSSSRRPALSATSSRSRSGIITAACIRSRNLPSSSARPAATSRATDAMSVVYGYSIMNDMTGNGMRAQDMVHYYALYPRQERPHQGRAARAASVLHRALQGLRYVRPVRPVARDQGRHPRPAHPRRALLAQGRSDRGGFHRLLHLLGAARRSSSSPGIIRCGRAM